MGSWEVRLTWLDCNQRSYIWIFGWTLREDVRLACAQTPELSFDLHLPFQLLAKEQKNNVCKYISPTQCVETQMGKGFLRRRNLLSRSCW